MRTIVAPLYIRPVKVVNTDIFHGTGGKKVIRRKNIMTWRENLFQRMLAYLVRDEIPLDDENIFRGLLGKIGYEPFLEIDPVKLKRLPASMVFHSRPDEIPAFAARALFKAVRPCLVEFRSQLQDLYRRQERAANQRMVGDLLLECWREACSYGFAHHFIRDVNGLPVHIIEGRDIRAGALIGLAEYLDRRGEFPPPPNIRYCALEGCGEPIVPWVYPGHLYHSKECRRKASSENERGKLVNRIQTKSRRMVEKGELTAEQRAALLQEMKGVKSLGKIKGLAKTFGVNPEVARAGRPPQKPRPPKREARA